LWLDQLRAFLPPGAPQRRLPSSIADDRLLGGIDLAATLKLGKPVAQSGILIEANGGIILIPMAERLGAGVAARIAATLDRGEVLIERDGLTRRMDAAIGVIAFDEGATPEEQLPAMLAERFAFHIDLNGIGHRGLAMPQVDAAAIAGARHRLPAIGPADDGIFEALVHAASDFAIVSVVAPLLALRASRAAAALAGRDRITPQDAALAARLVLAPRALALPPDEDMARQPEPTPQDCDSAEPPDETDGDDDEGLSTKALEDIISEAVQAALPPGLLERLRQGGMARNPPSRRDGTGALQSSPLRGRPIGSRMGALRNGARLALIETLRAAAPWQPIRRAANPSAKRVDVRPEDFRIRKFAQRRETSIIFCVDASGSAAFHRLAEAKGAVELLLAEAYVARTHAALVAFRGGGAELLLPPSRSLTRAKALLSTLPGGGGTPLAAGIEMAVLVALGEKAKGHAPLIVFLTDGQANIASDGQAARPRAFDDALQSARRLAAHRLPAAFVDTSARAREQGPLLAAAMGARYLALPRLDAAAMRDFVRAAAPAT
jgi:magnesium chelatase subunit D